MFCSECGQSIPDGTAYCIFCGHPVVTNPNAKENAAPVQAAPQQASAAPVQPAPQQAPAAPVQPAPQPAPAAPRPAPVQPAPQPPKKKSKAWIPIVIIGSVLLVMAIIAIPVAFGIGKYMSKIKDAASTTETSKDVADVTSIDTEPVTDQTEDTSEATTEATTTTEETTESSTETTTEATTTTTAAPSADLGKLYAGYKKYLEDNEKAFRAYKKMEDFYYSDDGKWKTYDASIDMPEQAALIDLTGDDVPELLCIHQYDNEITFGLIVLSYVDGKVKPVLTLGSLDIWAGGYSSYVIAKSKKVGELLAYEGRFDETSSEYYTKYVWNGSEFKGEYVLGTYNEIKEDDYSFIDHYEKNKEKIDKKEFGKLVSEFEAGAEALIFFNMEPDKGFTKVYLDSNKKILGESYDTVYWVVCKEDLYWSLADQGAVQDKNEFYKKTAAEYYMSSGAGAWGAGITIKDDGTFDFYYSDANAGESGDGYDGTTYYSSGKGTLSDAVKVSDTRYLVRVESMNYDIAPGTVALNDDSGDESYVMRMAATSFSTTEKGQILEIYLPGQKTSELDEDFLRWTNWQFGNKELPKELKTCGIYNGADKSGFVVSGQ